MCYLPLPTPTPWVIVGAGKKLKLRMVGRSNDRFEIDIRVRLRIRGEERVLLRRLVGHLRAGIGSYEYDLGYVTDASTAVQVSTSAAKTDPGVCLWVD